MKLKSPLKAYKSDLTGFYGSPRYVETAQSLGVDVGKSLSTVGKNIFTKDPFPQEPSKSKNSIGLGGKKHEGFGLKNRYTDTLPETPNVNTNLTKGGFGRFTDKDSKAIVPNLVELGKIGSKNRGIVTDKGKKFINVEKGSLGIRGSGAMMKGSPVKHDDQQEVSDQQKFQDLIKQPGSFIGNFSKAIKQTDTTRGGVSAEDFASGNYAKPSDATMLAQQRAANAGGSTGVDPFLPQPNQVAETGSYSGGRDRILEMDSNPVANQSIGRDTDIASQLFGSGQRASMLAMKGTPMHSHTPTNGEKYKLNKQ